MIYYVGSSTSNSLNIYSIQQSTFEEFIEWEKPLLLWQNDTETSVTNSIVERKLKLVQFGDVDGKDQWVIQVSKLTNSQAYKLLEILSNPLKLKIIQNVSFEYQIYKKYDIQIENVWDIMLADKILWCGYSTLPGFYGLKEITKRYLFLDIDKGLQTSFDCDIFTPEQITYAADDVKYLGWIMRLQKTQLKLANLEYVAALENEAVLGLSEIEFWGMKLDVSKWRENIALAEPIIEEANKQLDEFVRSEEFRDKCIEYGFLTDKESLAVNWNSTLQKKLVFNKIYPDLPGITQPIIKKFIKQQVFNGEEWNTIKEDLLTAYLDKDYSKLNNYLLSNHREWLIEQDLLIESNKVLINWQSPLQRLKVFQIVEPHLKSTDKQELADCDHPIIEAYQEYINATKLKTSFGEAFIEKHVDSDGRVRTRFNQIINTGRVSSSSPNLQNIPSKDSVSGRYRNAFVSDKGWLFCGSDYKSQEAVLVAHFSQDKVWLDALANDYDLHSVCAAQVFGNKWKEAAEVDCNYYKIINGKQLKQKCNCKGHKPLRTLTKTISFGLIYGMSKYKLSATAKISLDDAQTTINEYFQAFPGIKGILDAFGRFGVRNGFIMTSKPFNRRRYYDYWEKYRSNDYWMSKIERASRNQPIQGTSAEVTKMAIILMYWYIKDNNLWNKVKLVATIHDEVQTNVVESYAEEWCTIMNKCMCDAADFILPEGLLQADTNLTGNMWSK